MVMVTWELLGTLNDPCDLDNDGFTTVDGDCDDLIAEVNPSAAEVCDSIDNDCDTLIDDADDNVELNIFYNDADGDGYGDSDQTTSACSLPTGFS